MHGQLRRPDLVLVMCTQRLALRRRVTPARSAYNAGVNLINKCLTELQSITSDNPQVK